MLGRLDGWATIWDDRLSVAVIQMGEGILQSFNINELAGAAGLVLGALGALLAVIFKSRCHCKLNMCYLCQCERKPPPEKEVDSSEEEIIPPGQDQPVIDRSAPPPTTSP